LPPSDYRPPKPLPCSIKQVNLQHGLPFEVKIPNATTLAAIRQAKAKQGLTKYASVKDLMAEFKDA
jgi:antitoxin component of RelBE/YafQ-DinJ toxin-antitoxin module